MIRRHHGPGHGGLTRRDVDSVYPALRDAHDYIRSRRDASATKDMGKTALAAGEVAIGALGLGYLYGRVNHWDIPGTPIPMGAAAFVGGHLLNMFVLKGSPFAPHVANLANGALASWTTMIGAGLGTQARQKAGLPTAPITAGMIGCCDTTPKALPAAPIMAGLSYGRRPSPMTEAELAAMSRHVR